MITRQNKIDKIKEVIKPTRIGVPGHSVCSHELLMIGDVLDRIHNDKRDGEYSNDMNGYDFVRYIDSYQYGVMQVWLELRKSIDEQGPDCIDYVYSLLESDNSLCKNEGK